MAGYCIFQYIFRNCTAAKICYINFATSYGPNSIEGTVVIYQLYNKTLEKWSTFISASLLWSTAKGYNYSENQPHLWNETSASKVLVMNQGLEVVDLAMKNWCKKSEMDRPLQRYYRDMRAGLHNPPMEDAAYTNIAKIFM